MLDTPITNAWDCHVHCFEPNRYPYKTTRAYTPLPAPFDDLKRYLLTSNIKLVQATIEEGPAGLLAQLESCYNKPDRFPGSLRGTVLADSQLLLETLNDAELYRMHHLGIRCIRLHSLYGASGHDFGWVRSQLKSLAQLHSVKEHRWSISAQLSLRTWSSLKDFILTDPDLAAVPIVADHNACAMPSEYGTSALQGFLELLRSGKMYLKICALHRRSPGLIEAMQPIISLFAEAAPRALLWGSDWPHVDTISKEEAGPLKGDGFASELVSLRNWLSADQMQQMLVENPDRLFGR
jgi:predicted TIM-barrel fold metal-dependent hydrolase